MTCTTCGGALPAAGAKCAVCDPWAVPASDGAAGAAALPPAAQLAAPPLPRWLTRIIKKNPPAPADLDLAFRRSVISWSVSGAYLVVVVFSLLLFASRASAAAAVAGLALLVMSIALIVVALRFRNRTWLSRAVAVVGARPDIGYHWFAGIPQLVRRNQILLSGRYTILLLLVGRTVVRAKWPGSVAPQLILLAGYFAVALFVFAVSIALEFGAAAVLRTRLAQPVPAVVLDRSQAL